MALNKLSIDKLDLKDKRVLIRYVTEKLTPVLSLVKRRIVGCIMTRCISFLKPPQRCLVVRKVRTLYTAWFRCRFYVMLTAFMRYYSRYRQQCQGRLEVTALICSSHIVGYMGHGQCYFTTHTIAVLLYSDIWSASEFILFHCEGRNIFRNGTDGTVTSVEMLQYNAYYIAIDITALLLLSHDKRMFLTNYLKYLIRLELDCLLGLQQGLWFISSRKTIIYYPLQSFCYQERLKLNRFVTIFPTNDVNAFIRQPNCVP